MSGALARGYIQLIGVDESAYLKWSLPAMVKDMRALRAILPSVLAPSPARGRADLVTTASLTGHARIATTQIYTQPGEADRIKAKERLE